jgi:hypothetical protein
MKQLVTRLIDRIGETEVRAERSTRGAREYLRQTVKTVKKPDEAATI